MGRDIGAIESRRYQWTIRSIPPHRNAIGRLIRTMNSWGGLPPPFNLPAVVARRMLMRRLTAVKNAKCDFGMFMLYGNISGEDIVLSNVYILDYAPVHFGRRVNVGRDVKIITSWHEIGNFNVVRAAPVVIEDNVWLTMNIVVLPGVTIGMNTVVGAGSVVARSLPPNVVAAGAPARVVREIDRSYPWWDEFEAGL